ncbi:hypothetical protein OB2597_01005 [Pseudooceanicola batsensis HTCC2597]|uniref:UrcA family protein n=1 Tax=Pseudooceanicola batsensis (strain ATCC BAA-863 / DSM 15984 / KCTC 12145 / HTCC2597) TaxID=252305 RepID=A3U218_PSEBH|nr:hypothetical protein [Pseudooceanicola batsensis]EAQ01952.1 hypothetical protein OB2597_01005 [Pseudooceanicola batsensis HTCC2597]
MTLMRSAIAAITLVLSGASVLAQADPPEVKSDWNVVPTDAIRIEVTAGNADTCAREVIRAFNLPPSSLVYTPECAIVAPRHAYDAALNSFED